MKKRHIFILTALAVLTLTSTCPVFAKPAEPTTAADRIAATEQRARAAFATANWPGAQALYILVADARPSDAGPAARLMVASHMRGDSTVTDRAFVNALSASAPLLPMLDSLEVLMGAAGCRAAYPTLLIRQAQAHPYIARPLYSRLLTHATRRHDGAEMIKYATLMLRARPDDITALDALAWGQLYTGDSDAAEQTWRKILSIAPRNTAALTALGTLLSDSRPAEALDYLEQAYAITPTATLRATIATLRSR